MLFPSLRLRGSFYLVDRKTSSIHSIPKESWSKMGIPEGYLNITVAKNLFHGDQIYSRHDSSTRCGKVVVTDATYIMGDGEILRLRSQALRFLLFSSIEVPQ